MIFTTTEIDVLQILDKGGAYLIVLVGVYCLLTKKLVPGWAYRDLEARADRYEQLALRGTQIAKDATTTLKGAVSDETPH